MISIIEILSAICIIILGVTSFFRKPNGNKRRNAILILILCIIAYTQFLMLIRPFPFFKLVIFFTYTDGIVFYLAMPLLYIYVMNLLYNRPIFSAINGINILPALPGFIFVVYFNTLPYEQQLHTLTVKYCGVLHDNWLYILGMGSQLLYMVIIIVTIQRFLKNNKIPLSTESYNRVHRISWIMYILIFVSISVVIFVIILNDLIIIHRVEMFMLLFAFSGIYYLLFHQNTGDLVYITTPPKVKKLQSKKTKFSSQSDLEKIVAVIQTNELFKQPSLTMAQFSKKVKIPGYRISYCIKEQFNMSFPEYINKCRINYAKQKLAEDSSAFIKLDFFALECGFASRSNFYIEFKKQVGTTPVDYMNNSKK